MPRPTTTSLRDVVEVAPAVPLAKTILLLPPTLDHATNDYVAAFCFRGRGAILRQQVPLTMPDFLAWVRASMPKPYPLKPGEEHMVQVTRLDYDCGLTIEILGPRVVLQLRPVPLTEA